MGGDAQDMRVHVRRKGMWWNARCAVTDRVGGLSYRASRGRVITSDLACGWVALPQKTTWGCVMLLLAVLVCLYWRCCCR
jgi:hypothetical protein